MPQSDPLDSFQPLTAVDPILAPSLFCALWYSWWLGGPGFDAPVGPARPGFAGSQEPSTFGNRPRRHHGRVESRKGSRNHERGTHTLRPRRGLPAQQPAPWRGSTPSACPPQRSSTHRAASGSATQPRHDNSAARKGRDTTVAAAGPIGSAHVSSAPPVAPALRRQRLREPLR